MGVEPMPARDLYELLELTHGASDAEIKKAYKRLARKFHPDLNPADKRAEERFKEISEAYAILSDPEKKKQYDTYGSTGPQPPQGPDVHFTGFDFDAGNAGSSGFEDLFETFLHTAQNRAERGPAPGEDLVYPLTISLQEAYAGKKARISFSHLLACEACKGMGRVAVSKKRACPKCGGSGKMGVSKGPFSFARTCEACGGTGLDPGDACRACGGTGKREEKDTVEVTIPAGVDTGSRVRLKGKGQAGSKGGPPGDLYIETHVLPDPVFQREGPHLKVKLPLTFPEAVLGARIEVPTLSGGAMLKVPPGTLSGQVFRLKERGMPALRGGAAGDLLVEVAIVAPSVVDEKGKELLREFQRLNPENPRSYSGNRKG
jgi:molecular chaperone DnaJ